MLAAVAVPGMWAENGVAGPAAAGAGVAALLLFASGVAAGVARVSGRPLLAVALSGGLATLCICSFHLGDPFLLWEPHSSSSAALGILHYMNPLDAAVGKYGLGVEWLHLDLMYKGSGRLSMAAEHELFVSPAWWFPVLVHGGLGAALLFSSRGRGIGFLLSRLRS